VSEFGVPAAVLRVDLTTGSRQSWLTLMQSDPAGASGLSDSFMTPDGRAYVYGFFRVLDELHVVEGLS